MGFAIAGGVGMAKKYLECHEGFAEDGYNESGEKEKICGGVKLTSFLTARQRMAGGVFILSAGPSRHRCGVGAAKRVWNAMRIERKTG